MGHDRADAAVTLGEHADELFRSEVWGRTIDLGQGCDVLEVMHHGVLAGYLFHHPQPGQDHPCGRYARTCTCELCAGLYPKGRWTIQSSEPLTLSPSFVCKDHGVHGWIQEGKWVPV